MRLKSPGRIQPLVELAMELFIDDGGRFCRSEYLSGFS
jgi:hypothetical protein